MDGQARLSLLKRGEDYVMTMPYANCKGILLGTLTMEMGGKVGLECTCARQGWRVALKIEPFVQCSFTDYISYRRCDGASGHLKD